MKKTSDEVGRFQPHLVKNQMIGILNLLICLKALWAVSSSCQDFRL